MGRTALHWAFWSKHEGTASYLLHDNRTDPGITDKVKFVCLATCGHANDESDRLEGHQCIMRR